MNKVNGWKAVRIFGKSSILDDDSVLNTRFFQKHYFYKQHQAKNSVSNSKKLAKIQNSKFKKLAKNSVKAKQHPEAEHLTRRKETVKKKLCELSWD